MSRNARAGIWAYFAAASLMLSASGSFANVIDFDLLEPAFFGGSTSLNQSVGDKTGVATLTSGTATDGKPFASSIFENAASLGVPGSQLKDITGFGFDYYIAEDSNMSGGARMMLYIYDDEDLSAGNGVLQFDEFWKLDQTPEQWFSVSNLLTSPAGNASNNINTLYNGYKSWADIVQDHGDQYWRWAGILQDNPSGSTFSVDNVSITVAPASVPAPATLALFGLGLAGLGYLRRKKA